jgi:hypothetical protein
MNETLLFPGPKLTVTRESFLKVDFAVYSKITPSKRTHGNWPPGLLPPG